MSAVDQLEQDLAGMTEEQAARFKAEAKRVLAPIFAVSDAEAALTAARKALAAAEARASDAQQHYDAVAQEAANRRDAAHVQADEAYERETHRPGTKLQAANVTAATARVAVAQAEVDLATVRAAHPK